MMTRQEMFNKAWHGVIEQGGPSVARETDACVYRGENGFRCGIGHLIADDIALRWDKGGYGVSSLEAIQLVEAGFTPRDRAFLTALQNAHDDAARASCFMAAFKGKMHGVADWFNLSVPETGP
jgi:hypothetical protein